MGDSILPFIFKVWNKLQHPISSAASSSCPHHVPKLKQLNEMIYEVYTPPEKRPELEIVFFHGLQSQTIKDAYVTTWMSLDNSHLWIQTWLVELFPKARILTVCYDSSAEQTRECGMLDMYCTAENLVSSLIADEVRVGHAGSPVVFVGHCLGGLVLKELCLSAAGMMGRKRESMPGMDGIKDLLSNIRGMFFYGTPHSGSLLGDKLHKYFKGALLEEMETLKASSARRNQEFEEVRSKYKWITSGMGESRKTYVECLGTEIHLVPEASSRQSMDHYYSAPTDHYAICKADGRKASALQQLNSFLRTILKHRQLQARVIANAKKSREYFIDLNGRANQLRSMLAQTEVRTIFIVGLSGIGKTSLARQVYYSICHNFDVTCFVSLDSIEGQSNGSDQVWRKIQERLEGIHICSIPNLSSLLYQLKDKKVLLVLDNVESQAQLDVLYSAEWLDGSSSKLIVTSTTSRLGTQSSTFEVGYLTSEESQQLFRHYAFQGGEGPDDLRDVIQLVIGKCDGYPLFIKILAGFVSKESAVHKRQVWLDLIKRLAKAEDVDGGSDYRLWAKLKVCVNSLLPSEQETFLDIATIFHGFPLSLVKRIWRVSREEPDLAWSNLESRFLVSEDKHGTIHMHAQLRNLGHNIACPRSATVEQWKRISGYSLTKELWEKLVSKDKGPMETLALELKMTEQDIFKLNKTTFHNYNCLEYLILEGGRASSVTLWGKVKMAKMALPGSLVYLRWKDGSFTDCPLDFTGLKKLAVLELLDCKFIKSLPHSILKATELTWLELRGCSALRELPSGLSKCLEYWGLNGTGLREFPGDVKNFKKLVRVEAQHTKMTRVPQGLGGLEMLTSLNLSCTSVTTLPDSVGDLKCLKILNLSNTMLTSLPISIGRLQVLKTLNLAFTKLGFLPESIGLLRGLISLNLQYSTLQSLPDSVGGLQELRGLYLNGSGMTSLPQSIGDLVNLVWFHLDNTPVEALPDSMGKLCNLARLLLSNTQVKTLPDTMGELVELESLHLSSTLLRSVPQSLRNLSRLEEVGIDIGALAKSVELEEARRQREHTGAAARDWLSESTILSYLSRYLPFHVVVKLVVYGRGCPQSWVKPLLLAFQKMPYLRRLVLCDFDLVETIPCELGTLASLKSFYVVRWERLRELPEALGKLGNLEELYLTNNPRLCRLPESLGKLGNLEELRLNDNPRLCRLPESLPDLSPLSSLLVINCGSLQRMPISFCQSSTLERKSSTSECTQSDSLQPTAPPQLRLSNLCSDLWSLVECFLECCGKHFASDVVYYVKCKEMEKARKMATETKIGGHYALERKRAVEWFSGRGLHFSGEDNGCHRASANHRRQTLVIKCWDCIMHAFDQVKVSDHCETLF